MDNIFVIDSVNFLFRSYYAIGPMTNNEGISTSAVYGFIRSVKKLIKDFNPKYIVAVFDGPDNKAKRLAVYSEYKMNRKKAPDDLYYQFDLALEYLQIAGISTLCLEQVEADDTMGAITSFAKNNNLRTYLCTSDKDMMQLVNDKVFVLQVHKENFIFDELKVEEKYGILPSQFLDYLSIVGDTSDNIPGIPGMGPKGAAVLLKKYGSLDEIYKNLDDLSENKKELFLK